MGPVHADPSDPPLSPGGNTSPLSDFPNSHLQTEPATESKKAKISPCSSDAQGIFPMHSDQAIFVEIFAGCARLSRCAQQQGFSVIPVDGPRNTHKPECKILTMDLTDQHAQDSLMDTLNAVKPQCIHVALPCGTGSRAREKPISQRLKAQGAPQPRPLRDAASPLGMPGLSRHEQSKVTSANILAQFVVQLLKLAMQLSAIFSIENPRNSWMWLVLDHFVRVESCPGLTRLWEAMHDVEFSNCAHGGDRPKITLLKVTHKCLNPLALQCPGDHEHKPYALHQQQGVWTFDTAAESEYPLLLCRRFVALIKHQLSSHYKFGPPPKPLGAHQQTRKHASLIPEYHHITHTEPSSSPFKRLPPLATGDENGEVEQMEAKTQTDKATFGVYHTPQQFIGRALSAKHPYDERFAVEDLTRQNLFDMVTQGFSSVANKRLSFAKKVAKLSMELSSEEARFHQSLPPHVQEVLKGKRLLLFKHLLKETGCPDLEVFNLMQGVDLVGVAERSPFFGAKIVPACTTPKFALMTNKWQRKQIEARNIHEQDPELARTLWDTTLNEVDLGFLQGPFYDLDEVKKLLGTSEMVCSRRFAIIQGGKPRIIDDLKESGVNRAYTAVDQLSLHDIDYVTSLCHFITSTIRSALDHPDRQVEVWLNNGGCLKGRLHDDFGSALKWKARCVDLSKAYKQIPVSVGSQQFAVLMVHHFETGKPVYFVSRSLPFGASSSVFGFNRISKAIWHIASVGSGILGGVFFDDFPILEPSNLCAIASKSFEGLLKALGWRYTDDPKKCHPFDGVFDVLGARLDVNMLNGGALVVQNKPGRIEKIDEMIKEVQIADKISKRQAQVIHGNLNFAMGFVLGHTMKVVSRAFAALSTDACKPKPGQVRDLCKWARDVLSFLSPKPVEPGGRSEPVLVFTDAAYENDVATWGIVLVDQVTGIKTALGGRIPERLVNLWHDMGSQQVITLAEAFAVLLARVVLRDCIKRRRVLFFVDNEGARHSLIKGCSPTLALLQIVQLFHACGEHDQCLAWIERVPSSSNIADLPSRDKTDLALEIIGGLPWPFPCDVEAVVSLCVNFDALPSLLTMLAFDQEIPTVCPSAHDGFTGD